MSKRNALAAAVGVVAFLVGASFSAPARAGGSCDAIAATCSTLSSAYTRACGNSLPDRSRYPSKWLDRVVHVAETLALFQTKAAEAARCVRCGALFSKWRRDCDRRKSIVAKEFGEHVASKATHSTTFKTQYDSAMRRHFFGQALAAVRAEMTDVEQTQKVAAALGVAGGKLATRLVALKKMADAAEAGRRKKLASVRCPTKGTPNAAHFATVKGFFLRDKAHAKTLRQLRVAGRASARYDRLSKTTTETLPVTACFRASGDRCFVFELSLQRTKVHRGKWSGWDTVLVGAQREMLCANLD